MVVASYLTDEPRRVDSLMGLLYAFRAQSWAGWEAVVVHDGPWPTAPGVDPVRQLASQDPRIRLLASESRAGKFGHPNRNMGIAAARGNWLGLTNDDNYYAPAYFQWLIQEALRQRADFVYSDCVHSHRDWAHMVTRPRYRHLDLGGWLARTKVVRQVRFDKHTFNGDGDFINRLVARAGRTAKVNAALFVHN